MKPIVIYRSIDTKPKCRIFRPKRNKQSFKPDLSLKPRAITNSDYNESWRIPHE